MTYSIVYSWKFQFVWLIHRSSSIYSAKTWPCNLKLHWLCVNQNYKPRHWGETQSTLSLGFIWVQEQSFSSLYFLGRDILWDIHPKHLNRKLTSKITIPPLYYYFSVYSCTRVIYNFLNNNAKKHWIILKKFYLRIQPVSVTRIWSIITFCCRFLNPSGRFSDNINSISRFYGQFANYSYTLSFPQI